MLSASLSFSPTNPITFDILTNSWSLVEADRKIVEDMSLYLMRLIKIKYFISFIFLFILALMIGPL